MWDAEEIKEAIAEHPHQAADALAAIQLDSNAPRVNADAIKVAAGLLNRPVGDVWVETLDAADLLETFVYALVARGVAIDVGAVSIDSTNDRPADLEAFGRESRGFSCRIYKERQFAGSGVLVGPTTVLTAWHVIATDEPSKPQEPWKEIEVLLSDRRRLRAHVPAAFASMCSDDEYKHRFPPNDTAVKDRHDIAVLRLAQPAGAMLAVARLPDSPADFSSHATVSLVHFPDDQELHVGHGSIHKVRNLTARWAHSIGTAPGSSGGACFDAHHRLLGIHQGKDPRRRGRLVPARLFWEDLKTIVANDIAPPTMWSLDGTPDGQLVIGRQDFFQAFAAARSHPRVRGIRVRRTNAAGDLGGLPFTYAILERLIARSTELRLIRISFEELTADIADEIARRAEDAGFAVGPILAAGGVADGQSAPEAVAADRGRRVAALLDQASSQLNVQLWLFIDHPAIVFGDAARATLEAFIDASIHAPNLRLVIAGYEAVALPGRDFTELPADSADGERGLMTEMLSGFRRNDVRVLLRDAAAAAGKPVTEERLDEIEEEALDGLDNINGLYEPWLGAEVATRLRKPILRFFGRRS